MKIPPKVLREIDDGLHFVLDVSDMHVSDVTTLSQAWQMLYAASDYGKVNLSELYKYYNDNHIETALLAVFINCRRK